MPYIDNYRGGIPGGGATGSWLSTPIQVATPTSGGGSTTTTSTTVQQLAQEGSIVTLTAAPPTAAAPTEGLPQDARVGRFYQFASNPSTLYTIGPDRVWRALLLVRVT